VAALSMGISPSIKRARLRQIAKPSPVRRSAGS